MTDARHLQCFLKRWDGSLPKEIVRIGLPPPSFSLISSLNCLAFVKKFISNQRYFRSPSDLTTGDQESRKAGHGVFPEARDEVERRHLPSVFHHASRLGFQKHGRGSANESLNILLLLHE